MGVFGMVVCVCSGMMVVNESVVVRGVRCSVEWMKWFFMRDVFSVGGYFGFMCGVWLCV